MIDTLHFTGANVGMVYSSKGIITIIISGITGTIADKRLRVERAYMLCHLVCMGVSFYAVSVADPDMMSWVTLVNAMTFVLTTAPLNSVSYPCLTRAGPDPVTILSPIRIFGIVGFIVAVWIVGLLYLESNSLQLHIASDVSLLLSAYALALSKILVAKKGAITSPVSKLGLDVFMLFKNPRTTISFLFVAMLGAMLQVTNVSGSLFLHDFARNPEFADSFVVKHPSILLSVSQMAEVDLILTIPSFLKRFGIKTVILMSMAVWALRFGFFAHGDPSPTGFILPPLLIIVYGCVFSFFNISSSVLVERGVDSSICASAQGLFMTMVDGVGVQVGSILSGMTVDYLSMDSVKNWYTAWLMFAGYILFLAVIFFFGFGYNRDPEKITHRSATH